MFKLNEDVIHKSAGACVVCDIIKRDFGTGETTYYYLKPKFPTQVNRSLEIFLPIEKEKEFIRKPLSKTAVLSLINSIPSMEKIWVSDAKARKLMFEQIYHSGDMKGLCQLVKLLYVEPDFFAKPMSLTDKNFLTRIKNNIFDEFAVALDVHPSEIEGFIKQYLI
jgi:RNA polymerase-interacting CarD/CdnL/TRCF family regulator